jgi:hypothetical protein
MGPRRTTPTNAGVTLISGADDRVHCTDGVAALAALTRAEPPVRLIICAAALPDMGAGSFLARCAELCPDAYRALVVSSRIDEAAAAPARFADAVVDWPLTSDCVRRLLGAADASRAMRRENHRLRGELARARADLNTSRMERSRLVGFLTSCVQRVERVEDLAAWWTSISDYFETDVADIPSFPREVALSTLVEEVVAGLRLETSKVEVRTCMPCTARAVVDRVHFAECLHFALRGLVAGAPGRIVVGAEGNAIVCLHEQWDLSLPELDQLLEPFARLPAGPLHCALDLPLARLLAEKQDLELHVEPGPHCRGVRLVLELGARE